MSPLLRALLPFTLCLLWYTNSPAQSLLDTVHTVAATSQAVPVEETFTIPAAGNYKVTLVDLGAQLTPAAPLASVQLAVTTGNAVVGAPLTAAGSTQFSATASGTYIIHVVGKPGTGAGSGPIGIQVTSVADGSSVAAFSDTLAVPPSATASNVGVLDDSFTVTTSGTYQLTLSDFQLPQALGTLTVAIATQGGALVGNSSLTTAPGSPTASASVALQAGTTYRIFAAGQVASTASAGLYGVTVGTAGAAPVYGKATPAGVMSVVQSPVIHTAGSYTLSLADLTFPNPLLQIGAAVTLNGQSVTQLSATGSQAFTAAAATYQVFAFGLPGSSGEGSYTVSLQSSTGSTAFNVARAVVTPGGAINAYSYDTTTVNGETYALSLADFSFPGQFTSLNAVAVQNGAVLGSGLSAPGNVGNVNISPVAGPVSLLVFAQPGVSGGLFGLNLIANGAGTAQFQTTQGVGQLFAPYLVNVTTGGSYTVNVTDLGFPAPFSDFAVIITQGTTVVGKVINSGSTNFQAVSGDYFVNFVAQAGTAQAGTYAINVGPTPPAPTLSLQSSATSVASGGTVTLSWSSQNATTCSASGGWSGTQPVSGTFTTPALTTTTTFTLACTGSGGNLSQSITVTVTSAETSGGKGGGGGGAIRIDVLVLLLVLIVLRDFSRVVPARARK